LFAGLSKRENQRGQALAEFAICSLAALTIFFGIMDFGRALYTYHLVDEGARLATRYAIVNGVSSCAGGSPDPLQSYVSNQSFGITPSALTVATTCPGGNTGCSSSASPYDGSGCLVSVTVDYSFHFMAPFISTLVIPMSSRSQMVISQ
jgi:Flp pilus assembly protein TadG